MKLEPFEIRFVLFIAGFAILMGTVVYAREFWAGQSLSFVGAVWWQVLVWAPLLGAPWLVSRIGDYVHPAHPAASWFRVGFILAIALAFHGVWFALVSEYFSPLRGLPFTRIGVYPYFFIFFAMIDLVIAFALSLRMGVAEGLVEGEAFQPAKPIAVRKGGETILLLPDEIEWVGAEDYYAKLHARGQTFMLRQPLKLLMHRLPQEHFIQVHRSTIVRLDFIDRIEKGQVVLKDGNVRSVSKSGHQRLSQMISN